MSSSLSPHDIALTTVRSIEERVQRDEGGRGLDALLQPSANELYNAAHALISKKSVAIITGFPCLVDYSPPTETDGPLGAIAIADLLLKLGKRVYILTDECNEEPVLSCVAQSGIFNSAVPHQKGLPSRLFLESFPPRTEFDEKDAERLSDILDAIDCVIAIERVGPSADGNCYTMKGISMNHLASPLELLLISPPDVIPPPEIPNEDIVLPVIPASVLALESTSQNIGDMENMEISNKSPTEEEKSALLSLLESDVELSDEQFEALAKIAENNPITLKENQMETNNDVKDVKVGATFETQSFDYSNSGGMTMEELMAEMPPPPKNLTSISNPDMTTFCANMYPVNTSITSIGIGDGGNEVGMGKILSLVQSSEIPNASTIACVIPVDHLHVASVSNWGGYALVAAAVTILLHEGDDISGDIDENDIPSKVQSEDMHENVSSMMTLDVRSAVDNLRGCFNCPKATSILSKQILQGEGTDKVKNFFLTNGEAQIKACQGLVAAGARDGISKENELSVDGMPLGTSLQVLDDINNIVLSSL